MHSYTDSCGTGNLIGVLYEGYCYNNIAYQMTFNCQYGCSNRECICPAGQVCVTP
ncbi:MAG: hypothetical protein NTV63_02185 [Candidatus Woesearchaeota archaeon]|nr:hypothetical protein [Candidatus Woesearchaeota archaeon]